MELKSTLYGKIMVNANKTKTVIKKNPKRASPLKKSHANTKNSPLYLPDRGKRAVKVEFLKLAIYYLK